jgi:hypothetical protein
MEILSWFFCWPSSKETLSSAFGDSPRIWSEICRQEELLRWVLYGSDLNELCPVGTV